MVYSRSRLTGGIRGMNEADYGRLSASEDLDISALRAC
jgi:hypothetical protein